VPVKLLLFLLEKFFSLWPPFLRYFQENTLKEKDEKNAQFAYGKCQLSGKLILIMIKTPKNRQVFSILGSEIINFGRFRPHLNGLKYLFISVLSRRIFFCFTKNTT